jgi:hypothetical protein
MTVAADALMRQVRYVPNPKVSGLFPRCFANFEFEGSKICDFRVASGSEVLLSDVRQVKKTSEPLHERFLRFKTSETMP